MIRRIKAERRLDPVAIAVLGIRAGLFGAGFPMINWEDHRT
jgi:hypothetical protein